MRILHLLHTPRHSGAETLVRNLSLLHARNGVESGLAAFNPPEPEFALDAAALRHEGVRLYFPKRRLQREERVVAFARAIRDFRADVVFGHSVLPSLYGRIASLIARRPRFIGVLHDASNDDFADPSLGWAETALRIRLSAVVAVSRYGAESYRRRFGSRIPIYVVPNGIDLARWNGVDRRNARRRLQLDPKSRLMLQVGRIASAKQQLFSLEALAPLLREGTTKLWFAGLVEDSDYFYKIEQRSIELQVGDHVAFLGSRTDIPDLLAAADLYIMPSLAEAHSVAMIEALASGVPILASRIPTFEFAADYKAVVLTETGDKESFLSSARSLSHASHVERDLGDFAIEKTAEQYMTVASKTWLSPRKFDGIAS